MALEATTVNTIKDRLGSRLGLLAIPGAVVSALPGSGLRAVLAGVYGADLFIGLGLSGFLDLSVAAEWSASRGRAHRAGLADQKQRLWVFRTGFSVRRGDFPGQVPDRVKRDYLRWRGRAAGGVVVEHGSEAIVGIRFVLDLRAVR
jgi:hypothetical protein